MQLPQSPEHLQNFAANVEALLEVDPSLEGALSASVNASKIFLAMGEEDLVYYLQNVFFDAAQDLGGQETALPLKADSRILLILGIAAGKRVNSILNQTDLAVMVAESRPFLVWLSLHIWNWSEAIKSRRLRFFLSSESRPTAAIDALMPVLSSIASLDHMQVIGGAPYWDLVLQDEIWSLDSDFGLGLATAMAFGLESENSYRARAADFHKSKIAEGPISRKRPLRILAMVAPGTTALQTILTRYGQAFINLGHEFSLVLEDRAPQQSARMQNILTIKPDVILIPMHFGIALLDTYDQSLSLPRVTLLNNAHLHLERFKGRFDLKDRSDHYAFAPDTEQLAYVEENFHAAGEVLQLATTYEAYELPPEEEVLPIVRFIGSIPDEHGCILGLRSSGVWQDLVDRFWDFVNDDFMGDMDEFERSVRDLTDFGDNAINPLHLWSAISRISGLEALAGLPIEIYGANNWGPILSGGPLDGCYQRHLEPMQELPAVMSRALINVNFCVLGNTSAANMRTYDATGLGTCVVQDRKPEAVANFVEDEEMVFFNNPKELRAKVEALLANPDRAREIGRAARAKVMSAHTFEKRAATMAEGIYQHFEGWQVGITPSWASLIFPQG